MVGAVDITFPPELPVSQRRDDIAAAIRDHQVVVVAGETGSGKTTQLPKICLELGRGRGRATGGGIIGHTQPRRIAARSVAERIAEELGTELGDVVGYQVRFTDKTSRASRIKLMTDGILLAELQRDRDLRSYDTIIIDEAHERSLNIDFLLGYLKRLLPAPARPQADHHLGDHRPRSGSPSTSPTAAAGPAPIIEVSGRTYPVDIRYRPLVERPEEDEEGETIVRDQTEAIVDAVAELAAEGPGDILVFLPGEREIRDTAEVLGGGAARRAESRSCRSTRASRRPSSTGSSRSHTGRPHRARHQRRRDVADRARHQVRRRQRRRPYLPLLRAHQGAAAADRGDQPGQRASSGPAGAAASRRASRSGSTPRRTSSRGRCSPTPRSCAPTSPRSSSR